MVRETWHALSESELFKVLGTRKIGLTGDEAEERLIKNGYNELIEVKRRTAFSIFLSQFKSFFVLILIAAILISIALGEIVNAIVILAVVIVNTLLGFFQEYSAEKAVAALKRIIAPVATVIRNGEKIEVPSRYVVPGDIVYLDEGKRVPADMRLINQNDLEVDESSLTGESVPVPKKINVLRKEIALQDMNNMTFMGTYVTHGTGTGIVVETGMGTQIGEIAKDVETIESPTTPLQIRLEQLGKYLGIIILVLCTIIFLLGIYAKQGTIFELFLVAVALAISAIPEGLPAVVTLTLSIGMKRMAMKNAIVKRLLAVESLGTTSIICSDKTGTLTKNEMTVEKIYINKNTIKVSGKGYEPVGDFFINDKKINPSNNKILMRMLEAIALCNNSSITKTEQEWKVIGDPTEGALVVLSKKAGIDALAFKNKYRMLAEIPFSSERKMMSVVYEENNKKFVYSKGAPENILKRCKFVMTSDGITKLNGKNLEEIIETYKKMAASPLRVLAVAYKNIPEKIEKYTEEQIESNLIFLGVVGMEDPIREGVKEAIRKASNAGIKTVMITGDNEVTAASIAKQLGLIDDGGVVLTGLELESMNQIELENIIDKTSVFARVSPEHKVRILQAFESKGHVVAMTGDGVNDAPALKKADIGISMGLKGTDVAKEASDIILADDNYVTIVSAIEEGRGIYANIRKFVKLMLAVNFTEVFLISMTSIAGMPLPLMPLQLLWLNLVTDSFPAISLAVDPVEKDIMNKAPRKKTESIFSGGMSQFLIVAAIVATIAEVIIFLWGRQFGIDKARTLVLTLAVMFQMIFLFNCRSENKPFFKVNPLSNIYLFASVIIAILLQLLLIYSPILQPIFATVPLNLTDWAIVLTLSMLGMIVSPSFFTKRTNNNST